MKNQLELAIIAVILFFIFTNPTILEAIDKIFSGILGDEPEVGIKHVLLHTSLFGLCYFIILIITKSNMDCHKIDNKKYNNNYYDDDEDYNDCD
jgi:hypothetical protein